jgi:hypothetical protein
MKIRSLVILACLWVSCRENSEVLAPQVVETDFGTYEISTYVPTGVGSRWIYEVVTSAEYAVLDR